MIVLIDGYNLLRQIAPHHKRTPDTQKQHLIRILSLYKAKKKQEIKDILLVFDAGPFSHSSREVEQGVSIIFSGQKSSADEWIISYVEKHKEYEVLVVTNDRKLIQECVRHRASSIDIFEFYNILKNNVFNNIQDSETIKKQRVITHHGKAIKYEELECDALEKFEKSANIDSLMNEVQISTSNKDNNPEKTTLLRRSHHSLSKKEKKLYATMKKLK